MMITKENYEIFAIDFLDNNLDKETKSEMVRFLDNHLDIKIELESLKIPAVMVADPSILFEPKSLLKKEEKQKAIWLPTLLKFAATIALLLSISSVWYLNNKNTLVDNPVATNIDTTNSTPINNTPVNSSPVLEPTTITEINKLTPSTKKEPIESIRKTHRTPKQINKANTEVVIAVADVNELSDNTPITEIINPTVTEINTPIENTTSAVEEHITNTSKRTNLLMEPLDLYAQASSALSNGSFEDNINIPSPPSITINTKSNKPKGSWILDALTKKSDGTKIFAFQGVKRALTPTRLRDVNVDKTSTNSPLKQFTND